MSHLPPRPEFDYPPRPDSRYYGRPPPSDHPYPPRERDVYRASPPRPKRGDSYIAPGDSYVPRPLYPPPYDRHEEERYREYRVRDWERRDRDYPLPVYRADPRDWARNPRDRDRRWDDERSQVYDRDRRDRSPPRERTASWARAREDDRRLARERARPPSPERTWIPRASKSPPRRMVPSGPPSGSADVSVSRLRSPQSSPRRRGLSPPPSARYASPPSPRSRSRRGSPHPDTAENIRLGNHSISGSPRHPHSHGDALPSRQARYYPEDRGRERGGWRRSRHSRSRSWSRSHSRSYRRRSRSRSRPPRRRDSRSRGRSRSVSDRGRRRSRSVSEPGQTHSRKHTPQRDSKAMVHRLPPTQSAKQEFSEGVSSPLPVKQEPAEDSVGMKLEQPSPQVPSISEEILEIRVGPISEDVHMASPPAASPSSRKPEPTLTPTLSQQHQGHHVSSSPAPSAPAHTRYLSDREHVKTPTTPMSPQVNSPFTPLLPKPEWMSRASTVSVSTPPTSAEPPLAPQAEREYDVSLPDLPEIPLWTRPSGAPEFISAELARILARKERLTAEYEAAARDARRALHEYDIACVDLRFAEKKRKIADEQLGLARVGLFGVDYKHSVTQ